MPLLPPLLLDTAAFLQEYVCGDIAISNLTHPQWTEVTITANIFSPGEYSAGTIITFCKVPTGRRGWALPVAGGLW